MINIDDYQFQRLINQAMKSLPGQHIKNIQNIAILFQSEPDQEQRRQLSLCADQTLLGLYQGIPLSQRQGRTDLMPDRITLFKLPMISRANTISELQEIIAHTLWHEIGHYYGLDHAAIARLE